MDFDVARTTIAFSGAGGAGTIYAIRKLRPRYRIVAMDMNPSAYGLKLADAAHTVPAANAPGYIGALAGILKKENVAVYIPLIDEELLPMKELGRKLPRLKIIMPSHGFTRICLDKYLLANTLAENGLPAPKTFLLSEFAAGQLPYPFIIKPKTGRGSRGFARINNAQEFGKAVAAISDRTRWLAQEELNGTEYTVSVVVSQKNKVLSVVPKEVIEKKGITRIGVTRRSEAIAGLAKAIASKLSPRGPFNIQLMLTKRGPVPFEINPRFSTTTSLTMESGVDEMGMQIEDALGKKVKPNFKFRENLVMDRYGAKEFLDEKEWLALPRVLLTGASGNLGRMVAKRLAEKGHAIVAVSREKTPGTTGIACDLSNAGETAKKLFPYSGSIETIIHLAGMVPSKDAKDEDYFRNNVQATENMLKFAETCPRLKKFIFASSVKVYGQPKYLPVDARHPLNPNDAYAKSKLEAEKRIAAAASKNGFAAITFRLPSLFGGGIKGGALYHFVKNALEGKELQVNLNGEPWDVLHVEDAAEAIVSAAESGGWMAGKMAVVNPDYGEEIEIEKIAKRVAKLCKSKSRIVLNGSRKAPFYYKKDDATEKIRFKNRNLDAALKKYISSSR